MVRGRDILIVAALALLGLGLVMVQSAGMNPSAQGAAGDHAWWSGLWTRHTAFAVAAAVAMLMASQFNIARLAGRPRLAGWLVGGATLTALLLVLATMVPGLGVEVNGARRWLALPLPGGGMRFQPSELLKWVTLLGVAAWAAWRGPAMRSAIKGLGPAVLVVAAAAGLIVIEDLGTAVLLAVVVGAVLLAGGARWWHLGLLCLPAAGAVVAAVIAAPYRVKRLTTFMNPWADPAGTGYHPIQSMLAFAQGGRIGSGLGNSVQKYYLPEDTTDFVFPVLVEELGFLGAALVVLLILTVMWAGFGIVRRSESLFGQLLGLGVLMMFGLQAAFNLAVVTVVIPTKGIALPLISAGGTGWIVTGIMLGLIAGLEDKTEFKPLRDEAKAVGDNASPTVGGLHAT